MLKCSENIASERTKRKHFSQYVFRLSFGVSKVKKENQIFVGFCAFTGPIKNARKLIKEKIKLKGCDLLFANPIDKEDQGFGPLAKNEGWLFDKKNPLTARVFVNRIWQMHFGRGLTSTTDDLGSQGALPYYPELLDWLSIQFIQSGWNIKQLHKLILLSETYQQSSKNSPHIMAQDPENNLLARGPYFRMSAEMIRDNALSISGLLVNKLGGKSVYPYQPEGIWDLSDKVWKYRYKHDKGDGLYRRSLYTFWKRSAPPPSMLIFDTPPLQNHCFWIPMEAKMEPKPIRIRCRNKMNANKFENYYFYEIVWPSSGFDWVS